MSDLLPLGAKEIFVDWLEPDHGLRFTGQTDEAGVGLIRIYTLSWTGVPYSSPLYYATHRIILPLASGWQWDRPLRFSVDVELTSKGLNARITVPPIIVRQLRVIRLHARWGGPSPPHADDPANSNWSVSPIEKGDLR